MKGKLKNIMRSILYIMAVIILIVAAGFIIPQNLQMPVKGADASSYNKASFWYYPWGKSVTHKGVDIFAKEGTPIASATIGLVTYTGTIGMGGNVVLILGPKWRFHYYAHLQSTNVQNFEFVSHKTVIGTVGTSGNAKGKPAHLHYAIATAIPYPWRVDSDPHGWRKAFYLNPIDYL